MHRAIQKLSHSMAMIGGAVLSALILLTCLSVAGRSLNTIFNGAFGDLAPGISQFFLDIGVGPINGDFEVVEAGVAFAIFAFIPLCQITAGHASVDLFTENWSVRAKRILAAIIDVVFAATMILITVQLLSGTMSKYQYGETTFLLQFPVWWSYAASFVAACIACIASVYVALVRLRELQTNSDLLHTSEER